MHVVFLDLLNLFGIFWNSFSDVTLIMWTMNVVNSLYSSAFPNTVGIAEYAHGNVFTGRFGNS